MWCSTFCRKLLLFFPSVSDVLDVEETGGGVPRMSEDLSETSFSLRSASVVTVADTAGAAEGILWKENANGLCKYLGHV